MERIIITNSISLTDTGRCKLSVSPCASFDSLSDLVLEFPFGSFFSFYFSAEIPSLHYNYISLLEYIYNNCFKVLVCQFQLLVILGLVSIDSFLS